MLPGGVPTFGGDGKQHKTRLPTFLENHGLCITSTHLLLEAPSWLASSLIGKSTPGSTEKSQVSRAVVLQGIGAAPGVVRGAHERFWWTFDADAARCAVSLADGGQEEGEREGWGVRSRSDGGRLEKEVAELQGFLTR